MDARVADTPAPALDLDAIGRYRRDGYLVVPGVLDRERVEACLAALTALAADPTIAHGPRDGSGAFIALEPDAAPSVTADRTDLIRKFGDFTDTSPALLRAAMSSRLHAILDALMGQGRVLLQEMALVKPPKISGDKPWHQDAAYFRVSDPTLIAGVWIALDPALRQNGCMEVVPGSHLGGAVPHTHENDFNRCRIVDEKLRADERVALEMEPGDALVFSALLHHYTAPNHSDLRRRAIQFHYHQIGAVWGGVDEHRRLYHFADGGYAGCTVPHEPAPARVNYVYRGALARRIVPVDEVA
jgi:phytanoyl-CoA hydroxylase